MDHRLRIVSDESGLTTLVPDWTALWERAPDATPFQSPLWLMPWWARFGTGAPRVVTLWRDERLVGLLPLYRLDEGNGPRLLAMGAGITDYLDALLAPGVDPAGLLAALPDLVACDGPCELSALPAGSPLIDAAAPAGCAATPWEADACPVLALPPSLDRLRETVPRVTLRNLHQARLRAARLGAVRVDEADAGGCAAALDILVVLHARRWRERGESGVLADPRVVAFHRAAAPGLAEAGLLRLLTLWIGERPVASYYGLQAKGRAFAYLGGFDPDFPRESPGSLVLGAAIERAISEGVGELHFLRGREPYKYAWGAADRLNRGRRLERVRVAA